jgi:hypothetical protein
LVKFYAGVIEDLALYAKQLGWFHATPKSDKSVKEKSLNRAERIRAAGGTPLMPECDAEYLIGYWQDLNLCSAGAMGAIPLSATEIYSWCALSGVELEPWEFNSLRQMSQNYVSYLHIADASDAAPPYGSVAQEFDRDVVQKKLTSAFKAFMMAGKK